MFLINNTLININIRKPSKRFFQYLIYYVVLLIIIIFTICSVIYRYFISILQEEIQSSNTTALLKINETIDMRIKELDSLAVSISSNYTITYNSFIDDGFSRWKCVRELNKYRSSNMFIHDILLYNSTRNKDIAFTTWGVFDLDTLFTDIYDFQGSGQRLLAKLMAKV